MCGRFSIHLADLSEIGGALGVTRSGIEVWEPRYNVAPTQLAPVVRGPAGDRSLEALRWGLVPHWAKDLGIGARMINARVETVHEKPAFRESFQRRRCIVPVTGYFEWTGARDQRQPVWIHAQSRAPLWLAGLWSRWRSPAHEQVDTFTILTREATAELSAIHDRMPVALPDATVARWLKGPAHGALLDEIARVSGEQGPFVCDPVSPRVNHVQYDDPSCIERSDGATRGQLSLF